MGSSSSKSYKEPHKIKSVYFADFEKELPDLSGKTIAITGCTTGTGLVAAKTCAKKGARLYLLNRPSSRAEAALAEVASCAGSNNKEQVSSIECDLQSFTSVRQAAEKLLDATKNTGLDVMCNNAGVMALEDKATEDGYDIQMQTNHLSHFLLNKTIYPSLLKAVELRTEARIVNHSSGARKFPGSKLQEKYLGKNGGDLGGNGSSMFFGGARWVRYHMTKLANSVYTQALNDRLKNTGVIAACAAPGLAATNLQVTTNQQGGMDSTWIMRFAQSAEDGAMPLITCMLSSEVKGGDFYEPESKGNTSGKAIKVELDSLSADKDSRTMLWSASEAAVGQWAGLADTD